MRISAKDNREIACWFVLLDGDGQRMLCTEFDTGTLEVQHFVRALQAVVPGRAARLCFREDATDEVVQALKRVLPDLEGVERLGLFEGVVDLGWGF